MRPGAIPGLSLRRQYGMVIGTMEDKSSSYGRLISMWSIQDSLLQSYRNVFLTTQAVLFSVAVFIAQGKTPVLALPLVVIGLTLVLLWRFVVIRRGYDVWFFHLRMLRLDAGQPVEENLFSAFKSWQAIPPSERRKILERDNLGKTLLDSATRKGMDVYLPLVFGACWVFLCGLAAWLQFR
jgi:hypothetical protein